MKKILGVIAVLILCFSCYIAIYKKTENSEERLENQNIIQAKMKEENNVVEIQEKVEVVENKSTEQEKEKIIEQKTNETKPKTQDKVKKPAETKKETKTETTEKNSTKPSAETKVTEEKKVETQQTKPTEVKDTNTENKKLANTTYRKPNTDVIPKIINVLNDEISKDEGLKKYGSKGVKGNKADAYKNTNGFTYLFVKDIEKGKIAGNYTVFEQRIRNVVGALGKYHVYAEDEYVYNSTGTKSYWSQTLVWIYITF